SSLAELDFRPRTTGPCKHRFVRYVELEVSHPVAQERDDRIRTYCRGPVFESVRAQACYRVHFKREFPFGSVEGRRRKNRGHNLLTEILVSFAALVCMEVNLPASAFEME